MITSRTTVIKVTSGTTVINIRSGIIVVKDISRTIDNVNI